MGEVKNEVLFVMDSVGWKQFKKAKTPNIHSIGKPRRAISFGTFTIPSVWSMLLGCPPAPVNETFLPYGTFRGDWKFDGTYNYYILSMNPLPFGVFRRIRQPNFTYEVFDSTPEMVRWFLENYAEKFFVLFLSTETHVPYLGIDNKEETQVKAIEYLDRQIGELWGKLPGNTRIIITSDHGEFWDDEGHPHHGPEDPLVHNLKNVKQLLEVFLVVGIK